MVEATKDAVVLIATSFQALNRALEGQQDTEACDSTIVILFASHYMEASLNHFIRQLGMDKEFALFTNNKYHPSMQDKLAWFYNQFLTQEKVSRKSEKHPTSWEKTLEAAFPGWTAIHKFRNDVSHGVLDLSLANLEHAKLLRQEAKDIINKLFKTTQDEGFNIERKERYSQIFPKVSVNSSSG